jgi:hypothetical protein
MDEQDIARYVDASAALIGLAIAPEQRAGVLHYFGVAASMAALVMAVPLAPQDEPAALFVPVSPPCP